MNVKTVFLRIIWKSGIVMWILELLTTRKESSEKGDEDFTYKGEGGSVMKFIDLRLKEKQYNLSTKKEDPDHHQGINSSSAKMSKKV